MKLADGVRYVIPVGPKSELIVKVVEQCIEQSRVKLITISKQQERLHIDWLEENVVKTNGPLALNEGVQECLRIHQDVQAKTQEISDAVNEAQRLAERQDRLRQNIKAGGQDELTSRWRTDLGEAEQQIRQIEEERLPALHNEEKSLRSSLKNGLKSLAAEWSEEAG